MEQNNILDPIADKAFILEGLLHGQLNLKGQFIIGSNYTFLAHLLYEDREITAVYKPSRGEQPLWDFPAGTLAKREVAAFHVSESLGWQLVPPTVYRRKAPLGPGSLQLFIPHDPNDHYFTFNDQDRGRLRHAMAFDLLINNADRKGSHILRDWQDHFWLIDHGICFHVDNKLRTIIWDFAGEEIPSTILEDIERLKTALNTGESALNKQLKPLLSKAEISALERRASQMLETRRFPHPSSNRRYYPWPPI
ncbi:MAG: SCO1664 family protein [Anaerolineae bacterium]|nr:SCO1664 family protein [Anaerolineae bacterium]